MTTDGEPAERGQGADRACPPGRRAGRGGGLAARPAVGRGAGAERGAGARLPALRGRHRAGARAGMAQPPRVRPVAASQHRIPPRQPGPRRGSDAAGALAFTSENAAEVALPWVVAVFSDVQVAQGRLAEAEEAHAGASLDVEIPEFTRALVMESRGRLRLAQNRPEEALADLREAGRRLGLDRDGQSRHRPLARRRGHRIAAPRPGGGGAGAGRAPARAGAGPGRPGRPGPGPAHRGRGPDRRGPTGPAGRGDRRARGLRGEAGVRPRPGGAGRRRCSTQGTERPLASRSTERWPWPAAAARPRSPSAPTSCSRPAAPGRAS